MSAPQASRRYQWVRAAVLVLGGLTAVLYLAGLPVYYRDLVSGCLHAECANSPTVMPSAAQVAAIGLSVPAYSLLLAAIEAGNALVFFAVSALLFSRAPENRVALLGAFCLYASGAAYSSPMYALAQAVPLLHWPVEFISMTGDSALFLFLAIFPNGRFVPRSMRWVWIAITVLALFFAVAPDDLPMWENIWVLLAAMAGLAGLVLSPAIAQVYRYWRVSSPAEREQTKWVVYGVCAALGSLVALLLAGSWYSASAVAAWGLVYHLAYYGSILLIPLALLGAILLSRLWSIDVIIRRTLQYALLTAALAGLYLLAVVVLQAVVVALTGESRSTLVTVLSTLGIAALFSPLRAWLQRAVDRRFYRSRYSIEQALASFGATAQDDVELDGLLGRLVGVVEETMQPEHVSLWLRPAEEARPAPEAR